MLIAQSRAGADDLLQQAYAELRSRLEAGLPCPAETILEAIPTLASDPGRALEFIATEFLVRRKLGELPDPRAWLRRFPRHENALRTRFRALGELAERTGGDEPPTSPHLQSASIGHDLLAEDEIHGQRRGRPHRSADADHRRPGRFVRARAARSGLRGDESPLDDRFVSWSPLARSRICQNAGDVARS